MQFIILNSFNFDILSNGLDNLYASGDPFNFGWQWPFFDSVDYTPTQFHQPENVLLN